MESYPETFAALLKHLAEEARMLTEARAHGDQDSEGERWGRMEELKQQLVDEGVLGEDPCQQIFDMAGGSSNVALCEAFGWDGLEDRQQEFSDAFNPVPDDVEEPLWCRTREMFLAASRLACAEVRGAKQDAKRQRRIMDRQARSVAGFGKGRGPTDPEEYAQRATSVMPGFVVMFSGCQDEQTSADVSNTSSFGLPTDAGPGGAGGACTSSMIKALSERDDYTWVSLLERMRSILAGKYTQIPMLSSSRVIDLRDNFSVQNDNPSGRSRALLVGINYVGTGSALSGCHNDVETMRRYLQRHGYNQGDMRIQMDDGRHEKPTKENIQNGLRWLVEGAGPGDSLFFHYSGHGASVADDDGDEKDGKDECLVPADYERVGLIRDDDLFKLLVAPLQEGVALTCVMDCCHSGTILDLPYMFKADDESLEAVASGSVTQLQQNPNFDFGKLLQVVKDHPALAAAAGIVAGIAFFAQGPEKGQNVARTLATAMTSDDPMKALQGAAGSLMGAFFGRH